MKLHVGAPDFGRDKLDHAHAVFVITESLRVLGLTAWTATLLHFLGRFDGIEMHIDEESDPLLCVRQVLLSHVADSGRACSGVVEKGLAQHSKSLMQRIVTELMQQDFLHHRSYWSAQPPRPRLQFDSLQHSWLEFITLGQPGEEVWCWRPERGNPRVAMEWGERLLQG